MEDQRISLASGPLHFGLAESPRHPAFPAAISSTGQVYRLEKKQSYNGKKKLEGDIPEHFRFRCINTDCRQFLTDEGRVNHSASCQRHSETDMRQWVGNWLAYTLFEIGGNFTERQWAICLDEMSLPEVSGEYCHVMKQLDKMLCKLEKEPEDFADFQHRTEMMMLLVEMLNASEFQKCVSEKGLPFQLVDPEDVPANVGRMRRLLEAVKDFHREREAVYAKFDAKKKRLEELLEKWPEERERYTNSSQKVLDSMVEKLEDYRVAVGGRAAEEEENVARDRPISAGGAAVQEDTSAKSKKKSTGKDRASKRVAIAVEDEDISVEAAVTVQSAGQDEASARRSERTKDKAPSKIDRPAKSSKSVKGKAPKAATIAVEEENISVSPAIAIEPVVQDEASVKRTKKAKDKVSDKAEQPAKRSLSAKVQEPKVAENAVEEANVPVVSLASLAESTVNGGASDKGKRRTKEKSSDDDEQPVKKKSRSAAKDKYTEIYGSSDPEVDAPVLSNLGN
jgi:antitoxin component of RelBE/YafQ-DinJ toxin-antitoxin module